MRSSTFFVWGVAAVAAAAVAAALVAVAVAAGVEADVAAVVLAAADEVLDEAEVVDEFEDVVVVVDEVEAVSRGRLAGIEDGAGALLTAMEFSSGGGVDGLAAMIVVMVVDVCGVVYLYIAILEGSRRAMIKSACCIAPNLQSILCAVETGGWLCCERASSSRCGAISGRRRACYF